MKFSQVPYTRPNLDDTLAAYDKLITAAQSADCDAALLEVFDDYQALNATLETAATLASIRHTINTNDSFYEAENDFFDEAGPVISDKKLALYRAFLASSCIKALDEKYGAFLRQKMELEVKSASPEIIALMQQENAMETQYQKLYAGAKIPFDGKIFTVPQMSLYKQSPDRAVRKAAYEAEGKFFDDNREKLDELYDKLVKNRTQQAKALGFDSYTPLGYIRMKRMGYDRADVESYRKQVVESIVPFVCKLKKEQAERIGATDFKFYDDIFRFKGGNAAPQGTPDEILAAGKKMYQELSAETAAFIDEMFEGDLFDVLSKEGKAPGGYCTYIPALKMPFIFSNFNATADDVDVLTHEAGHAFAAYTAARLDLPAEYNDPSLEACEIHSMSMEFLTSDFHHLFFGENTQKYQLGHAEDALIFLPYGSMVDEFQHIVYDNPDFTPAQRNEEWLKLEHKYRPYIDFEQLPFYSRGAGWQRQLHIYECPFYYIDYCLAQTVALQFFAAFLQDKENAWERYVALVNRAGTDTYTGLVESAGFTPPFEPGCLQNLIAKLAPWFEQNAI